MELGKFPWIRRGITSIELIVVTAVIAFLFTITAVSIRNFFLPSSQDISQTVQGSLIFAYNHALLNHKTVIFQLDFEKQEYRVFRVERDEDGLREEPITKLVKLPFNNNIFEAVDLSGKKRSEGILRISYTHDGTGEDYTLLMGSQGNVKKSIQVFRYGGRVKLENGENLRIAEKKLQRVDYGVDERRDDSDSSQMNRY